MPYRENLDGEWVLTSVTQRLDVTEDEARLLRSRVRAAYQALETLQDTLRGLQHDLQPIIERNEQEQGFRLFRAPFVRQVESCRNHGRHVRDRLEEALDWLDRRIGQRAKESK